MSCNRIIRISVAAFCIASLVALSGCGLMSPAQKPDAGPGGKPVEAKPNPPVAERFTAPPTQLFDLEAIAGTTFEGINKEKWTQAESGLANLQTTWQQVKPELGDMKGVKDADEALGKLSSSIAGKQVTASYENLNKFMGGISDVGKNFKLSPLANIIAVGNGVRDVAFYVEDKNWSKSASKVKGLENTWNSAKSSLEQVGILGEVIKTHSRIKQLKDAVNGENKGSAEEHISYLNESLGRIRDFYRGK